jgi:predicted DNA-binding transcriptional regulator AlpA
MAARILTFDEVSERTNIPIATLRWYRAKRIGPTTFRLGGRVMARENDVDEWIQAQYLASVKVTEGL